MLVGGEERQIFDPMSSYLDSSHLDKVFVVPERQGKRVSLRPILAEDYSLISRCEQSPNLAVRWRFRGSTPSPEQWAQAIWSGVLAQFLVVENGRERPIGIVSTYAPNFQHGHAKLGAARFDTEEKSPAMVLGVALFIEYVFCCWNFRKLYLEVPEYNFGQFAHGVGRFFKIEGRLEDYSYVGHRYWDEVILSLSRRIWAENSCKLLKFA